MRHPLLLFTILFLALSAGGQNKTSCFGIKYLDFFGLDSMDAFKWPIAELDQLLVTDFVPGAKEKSKKTNFLIPYIVIQLKDYHPSCTKQIDTAIYSRLTQLYAKIRQQDFSKLNAQPVPAQLEFIKNDFYEQVQNDSLLPFMNYTLDDGLFMARLLKIFQAIKKENHLWTRIMTGNSNRPLTEISFSQSDIFKTSLGYQLRMFSEGEALNLYLKSNGELRCYFHSW